MKNESIWLGLLVVLLSINIFAQAKQTPEQAAKSFYIWYFEKMRYEEFPIRADNNIYSKRQEVELSKRTSKRLRKWIDSPKHKNWGADYFLDAQDWNENWEKGIVVSGISLKGNIATVKVVLSDPKGTESSLGKHILTVKLVKENSLWKIDRVNGN